MSFIDSVRRKRNKEQEALGLRRGYYLVKGDARHFIAEEIDEPALNRVADRVLSDAKGWSYWIDYSHGADVHGNPAWSNLDHTDRFL
jgi:hypothetical protein